MDDRLMRTIISKVYPGEKWKNKCLKMSKAQVCAIYMNMKKNGKI